MDVTLLVLAAGMGSRYGGLKQIDPMGPGGETLLDYSVYDAIAAGFSRVVFVIRREFEADFRERFGRRYEGRIGVDYAFQDLTDLPSGFAVPEGREKPWGTAHAVRAARHVVNTPFAAINADDFYGAGAYRAMAGFFADNHENPDNPPAPARFAMVGYRLDRTLTEHGSVSRGICEVDADGHLTGVVERTKILQTGGGPVDEDADGHAVPLTGGEVVSMNFWGFTPDAFPLIESSFSAFLSRSGSGLKSEFYIPVAVADWLGSRAATVTVLSSTDPWFGVTYRDDRAAAVANLKALAEAGTYPTPLFG